MSQLTLKYVFDASYFDPELGRDDFGSLSVKVATDRFSGTGHFWVPWQDVVEFGESLAVFPISDETPIKAEWGFNKLAGDDLIFRIAIIPADERGNLSVHVEVADQYSQRDRVRASFCTNYPDLERFRLAIAQLMAREVDEAVLAGNDSRYS